MNNALVDIRPSGREFFAAKIGGALSKSVEGFIEAGSWLTEAKEGKDRLPHGEFLKMVEDDLKLDIRTAQRLMLIAKHPIISNAAHAPHLPPIWYTIYELTKVPDEGLMKAIEDGRINPKMERKDVAALKAQYPKPESKTHAIDEALKSHPSSRNKSIAEMLNIAPSAVSVRRSKLQQQGVIPTPRPDLSIEALLKEDPHQTDISIARRLNRAPRTVKKQRQQLEQSGAIAITPRGDRTRKPCRGDRWITKQLKAFNKSIAFIFNACEHGAELPIPPLNTELKTNTLDRIREAERALRTLKLRIKETANVSSTE